MIRRFVRLAGIALGVLTLVPLHYLWRLVGARSPWPRRFLWWAGWCAGLRITVRGEHRRRDVMFVANHLSWLDILAIGGHTGAAFVAKAELADFPVIRWLCGLNDTIFVEREDRGALREQAETVRAALARRRAVAVFPEATTTGGADTLPFRASLLSALFPPLADVQLQPIALDFGARADEVAWIAEHGADNARRLLSRPGTIPLILHFLPPIDPAGPGADRKLLASRSRDAIVAALGASAAQPAAL